MSKFKYPEGEKAQLAWIKSDVPDPEGLLGFFRRVGIGFENKCPWCPFTPAEWHKYPGQRWKDIVAHIIARHVGKARGMPKVGAAHGVERSRDAKRRPPRTDPDRRSYAVQ